MVRLTRESDYAIVLMVRFAQDGEVSSGRLPLSARGLAADCRLPLPMVGKILKTLTREGLLRSQRGAKGGYTLAHPAEAISIAEIVHAIEGPIAMTECSAALGSCENEPTCSVRGNWQLITHAVRDALGGLSLAQMARPLPPATPHLVNLTTRRPQPALCAPASPALETS